MGPQADDELHPADTVDNKEITVVVSDRDPTWLSDPDLRQRGNAGLNKGEASNSVRRAVFFHRQGREP